MPPPWKQSEKLNFFEKVFAKKIFIIAVKFYKSFTKKSAKKNLRRTFSCIKWILKKGGSGSHTLVSGSLQEKLVFERILHGNVNDIIVAPQLIENLNLKGSIVLADKASSSTKFIKLLKDCLQHVTTNWHVVSLLLFTLRVFWFGWNDICPHFLTVYWIKVLTPTKFKNF